MNFSLFMDSEDSI